MTTTDGSGAQPDAPDAPRPRRTGLPVAAAVLVALAGVAAVVLLSIAGSAVEGGGRVDAPPWAAPADVEQRAEAAGLTMLTGEGNVLHLHEHLSVAVDGKAVVVPSHLGIDEEAGRISPIHTHDRTGIVHVESAVATTFRLGQVFTEWDVALGDGRVGGYRDGHDGVRVGMFVDGSAFRGDPRGIVLRERQDLDLVVTTDGSTPRPPAAFRFPANS